jgi:hypothetical protein
MYFFSLKDADRLIEIQTDEQEHQLQFSEELRIGCVLVLQVFLRKGVLVLILWAEAQVNLNLPGTCCSGSRINFILKGIV